MVPVGINLVVYTTGSFDECPGFYAFLVGNSLAEVSGCVGWLPVDTDRLHGADWSSELALAPVSSQQQLPKLFG